MSRQVSIFTKGIACVLIAAMCAAFVPATGLASSDPCQSLKDKAWAASGEVAAKCTTSVIACGAAIAVGNWWGLAGCIWVFYNICQPAQLRAADAWAAYWDCVYEKGGG